VSICHKCQSTPENSVFCTPVNPLHTTISNCALLLYGTVQIIYYYNCYCYYYYYIQLDWQHNCDYNNDTVVIPPAQTKPIICLQVCACCPTYRPHKRQVCGNLWKEIHRTSSVNTTPEVISSSANWLTSSPNSSCLLNWMPQLVNRSMESCAYMSSL